MTQLRSHPRLVRKLQDAFGDELCVALADATVVEIMLNPDGRLFIERLGHGVAPAGAMSTAAAARAITATLSRVAPGNGDAGLLLRSIPMTTYQNANPPIRITRAVN